MSGGLEPLFMPLLPSAGFTFARALGQAEIQGPQWRKISILVEPTKLSVVSKTDKQKKKGPLPFDNSCFRDFSGILVGRRPE